MIRNVQLGMGVSPPGYRQMLRDNLAKMQSFGIRLCTADRLYDTCRDEDAQDQAQQCAAPVQTESAPVVQAAPEPKPEPVKAEIAADQGATVRLDKHVISNRDIRANRISRGDRSTFKRPGNSERGGYDEVLN